MTDINKKMASKIAKLITVMCVRNTELENIHAGKAPVTKTGDYSDIKVIDAEGNEFTWNEASRIDDDEMKALMKQIVNRVYTYFIQGEDPRFQNLALYYMQFVREWDDPEPEIDPALNIERHDWSDLI